MATVDGVGSTLTNTSDLFVGYEGVGSFDITGGGLVSVGGMMKVDYNGGANSFVSMSTGGMLALYGHADSSLVDFYTLVGGTDAIRYWDDGASDWSMLTGATLGTDYWLDYQTEGDLMGYTLLTVGRRTGDLDGDGAIDATDIDALAAAMRSGSTDPVYDLNGDGEVTLADLQMLVTTWVDTPSGQGTAMGDFNLDGEVGLLDLAVLGDGYNGSDGWAWGDANGDGIVGLLDLAHLGENYGFDRSAIPEPASAVLLLSGVLTVLKRRR